MKCYKYTGHERDTESSLDHTLHRQYAPNLARWMTPDPVHGSPDNPQSWNRYPYVLNDPLALIDPLGGRSQNEFLVGCYPNPHYDYDAFGCNWDEDNPCPPGFWEIYGTPVRGGGSGSIQGLPGGNCRGVGQSAFPPIRIRPLVRAAS